jgi:D-galactose 1-dehydrogenase
MAVRIGVVGLGQIARGQHLAALAGCPDFEVAATASPGERLEGIPGYDTLEAMLRAEPDLQAVTMCQPTQARFADARRALEAGVHVLLEKPPAATTGEVKALIDLAQSRGLTLHASWHSRHAPGVEPTRRWLADRRIRSLEIIWREDVRQYHPGCEWVWRPGGLGVFDSIINAFSILTHVFPTPLILSRAMHFYPANRAQPAAAELSFSDQTGAKIEGVFDWRHSGPSIWDMRFDTDGGPLLLTQHGGALSIAGAVEPLRPQGQYPDIYRHFAGLIAAGRSDVDEAPLRLVADAFLCAEQRTVEPFDG